MKLIKYICNEKATISFNVKELIRNKLNELEIFLKYVKEDKPNSFDIIIKNLISQFEEVKDYQIHLETNYELLNKYPKLLEKSKNTILSLLNYSKYPDISIDDSVELNVSDVIRTMFLRDYLANSLRKIISREESINYSQNFICYLTQQRRDPKNYINNFDDRMNYLKSLFEVWQAFDVFLKKLDEGTIVYKKIRCRWAEIMKEINLDPELSYTVHCHADFEGIKNLNSI